MSTTRRMAGAHVRRGTVARTMVTMGVSLLVTGLVVLGAAGTATADGKANPGAPGNNGTVKVGDSTDIDEQKPENDPHLPCTFNIQWFSYDSGHGRLDSTVGFELQAPTDSSDGVTMTLASGSTTQSFIGNGGQPGAGSGRDHIAWYTLAFTGPAQPQQGYHVKITVNTPHSQGNDVKHKVFWVGPCEAETTTPSNPVTTPSNPATTPSGPASSSAPAAPSSAAAPSQGGTVAGTETTKPRPQPKPGKESSVLGTQAVAPTAVAAGDGRSSGPGGTGSGGWAWFLVATGLALAAGGGALGLRGSRGRHQA